MVYLLLVRSHQAVNNYRTAPYPRVRQERELNQDHAITVLTFSGEDFDVLLQTKTTKAVNSRNLGFSL